MFGLKGHIFAMQNLSLSDYFYSKYLKNYNNNYGYMFPIR